MQLQKPKAYEDLLGMDMEMILKGLKARSNVRSTLKVIPARVQAMMLTESQILHDQGQFEPVEVPTIFPQARRGRLTTNLTPIFSPPPCGGKIC